MWNLGLIYVSPLYNDAITPETVDTILAGKQIDVSQTEFCRAYNKQLDEMARRYLQR